MARPGHERFTQPTLAAQRRYEALRAYHVEELSAAEIAERFGYTKATVQTLISQYRDQDLSELFASSRPGPKRQPKKDAARERVLELRRARHGIEEIVQVLRAEGTPLSRTAVWEILKEARLSRNAQAGRQAQGGARARAAVRAEGARARRLTVARDRAHLRGLVALRAPRPLKRFSALHRPPARPTEFDGHRPTFFDGHGQWEGGVGGGVVGEGRPSVPDPVAFVAFEPAGVRDHGFLPTSDYENSPQVLSDLLVDHVAVVVVDHEGRRTT
jgi:transposase